MNQHPDGAQLDAETARHRDRLAAALTPVITLAEIAHQATHGIPPPERNVFDWSDGLRLIISREAHDGDGILLHVSASCEPGSALSRIPGFNRPRSLAMKRMAARRYEALTGNSLSDADHLWSSAGYSHWFIPETSNAVPGLSDREEEATP